MLTSKLIFNLHNLEVKNSMYLKIMIKIIQYVTLDRVVFFSNNKLNLTHFLSNKYILILIILKSMFLPTLAWSFTFQSIC